MPYLRIRKDLSYGGVWKYGGPYIGNTTLILNLPVATYLFHSTVPMIVNSYLPMYLALLVYIDMILGGLNAIRKGSVDSAVAPGQLVGGRAVGHVVQEGRHQPSEVVSAQRVVEVHVQWHTQLRKRTRIYSHL